MVKSVIQTDQAPAPVARYSQAVKAGNTLYVQGLIALDPVTGKMIEGGIDLQTIRVFESVKAILAADKKTFADIVKLTAFLSDLSDYPKFNEVYNSYFSFDQPPARTTVQAKMPLGALLEVEVIAWKE